MLFAARTGVNAVHVPFRGAAQTIPAMLSGDVKFAVDNLASYMSQIESGQMRALAVTSAQRWPTMPNVPTMEEAGVKDFVVTSWAAYVVPAGTPQAIVDKLSAAHKQLATDEALQKRFLTAGARLLHSTPPRRRRLPRRRPRCGRRWCGCRGSSRSSQKKLCGSTSTSSLSVPLRFGACASQSRRYADRS